MSKTVDISDLIPVIRESVSLGTDIRFTPRGTSMLPMLHNNTDTVVLTKAQLPLKKYDLPLYHRRGTDTYILHRVIKVCRDGSYVMCGDSQTVREPGVTDDDIIAVVKSYTRKHKKTRSTSSFPYRLYCRVWRLTRPLRNVIFGLYARLLRAKYGKRKKI